MEITSLQNEKIKFCQKLKLKKYRDQEKLFLIEDEHLINEALKRNMVKEIYTVNKELNFSVPTYYVTEKIMKLLSSQVTSAKTIAVSKFLEESAVKGNAIILDNIQDPGNLGTIIRSAVAFNFETIILSKDTVDLYNPKVIRASEGMIFNVNILRRDLPSFLDNLDSEYVVIGTDVNNGEDIKELNCQSKLAVIIGNEGQGMKKELYSYCDKIVNIKMMPNCESLNAGVSASIIMFEVYHG